MNNIRYSVVVPVFNEEDILRECTARLSGVMKELDCNYEIIFVNDGSRDRTKEIFENEMQNDPHLVLVNFSRNFGHQGAITAGMREARGDAVIVIDADLQDPPELIPAMIAKWKEGFDVVYGKRVLRKKENLFKKLTAFLYYRILRSLTDVELPVDAGDFRLIDRRVCDELNSLGEHNRYVRGLVSWLGFRQGYVEYVREGRLAGETKYPLAKMLTVAFDGITSFSKKPLQIASYMGFLSSLAGFLYLTYSIGLRLFTDRTIQGWTSIMAVNLLFFGIIMIILGIIGEYIGRLYDEAKARPLYVVESVKRSNLEGAVNEDYAVFKA